MTEDEAKTKYCPVANVAGYGNRDGEGAVRAGVTCAGSACMVWRWNKPREKGWARRSDSDIPEITYHPPHDGYCGLARTDQ